MRYTGIKNNKICIVSSEKFSNEDFVILEVPAELNSISTQDLMVNYRIRNEKIIHRKASIPANDLKVAFIGNHAMECGIATYNFHLWGSIINHIKDYKFFIEEVEKPTNSINLVGKSILKDDQISACWKRGETLKKLTNEIKNYNPDIILISHEWGIFPNARYWLSLLTQLSEYRIITIMHSVFPNHKDKLICEAAMKEIVVHLDGAKTNLKEQKNVSASVSVIPHGCYPFNDEKLWNFYKSDHTFFTCGFGYKYKSFETSIEAVALLKAKYNDIFLSIIFSESPYNQVGHQLYYEELINVINQLNVQENVAIIRGFQPDNIIDSYFRTNKAAVFPYYSNPQHEVFGASGAARLAMAANIPVITSDIPHFNDLCSIKANTSEQISKELDKLFSNKKAVEVQLEKQKKFVQENSWENTAKKYIKLFENY